MPPAAFSRQTASPTVGVGATPTSCTSQPASNSPARTAWRNIDPLGRPSRPSTTRPPPRCVPSAEANDRTAEAVSPSPTMPRTPDTLTISPLFAVMAVHSPLLADAGGNTHPADETHQDEQQQGAEEDAGDNSPDGGLLRREVSQGPEREQHAGPHHAPVVPVLPALRALLGFLHLILELGLINVLPPVVRVLFVLL